MDKNKYLTEVTNRLNTVQCIEGGLQISGYRAASFGRLYPGRCIFEYHHPDRDERFNGVDTL
ncbi:MAG: hypothetical protein ACI9JR_003105, partial [Gammaproteobacteria bacterium]